MATATSSLQSSALALLRVVAAFSYTLHGAQKFGALGGVRGHAVAVGTMPWFAALIEVIAGPLIFLGLFTRPVAFIASGEMAVAYLLVHTRIASWYLPLLNMGESAALYCFIFLYLVTSGAGKYSLDSMFFRKT